MKALNEQEVDCGKGTKKNWLNAKFKNKHIQSVKNVITSELCRIYCNINPYKSGRYTDKSDDVLLLDCTELNASGQQIFKDIDKYDIENWNYIFLINYMNWLKNNGIFSTLSTDKLLSNRLQKIIDTLRTNGVNITEEMRSHMQKAKQDIVYYVENLKLKDFWQSIYDDKDKNGNYINRNPNNKKKLLASQNDNFYTYL